jgi:tetratricopeptide (TPR) repeat protein
LGSSEKSGDLKQAVGHLSEAVRMYEALVASNPVNVEWQMNLARSRAWLGEALAKGGEFNEAIAQFDKAVSIKTLVKTRDSNIELLQTLGELYYGQGGMFETLAERKAIPADDRQRYRKGAQSSYAEGADILIEPNGQGVLDYDTKRVFNGILAGKKRLEQIPTT